MRPGVYTLSFAEYQAAPGVSRSTLWGMEGRTDAAFKAWRDTPRAPTANMTLGTATHCLMFEPQDWATKFPEPPDLHPNSNDYKAWKAALAPGAEVLGAANRAKAQAMHAAILAAPMAAAMLRGYHEKSFFWIDEDTGLLCKCRPDSVHFSANMISDLKTTDDASPGEFVKSVYNLGYHVQAPYYLDGVKGAIEQAEIRPDVNVPDRFAFVAVESSEPHQVALYDLPDFFMEEGRRTYKRLLKRYAAFKKAEEANEDHPSFPQRIMQLTPHPWMFKREGAA